MCKLLLLISYHGNVPVTLEDITTSFSLKTACIAYNGKDFVHVGLHAHVPYIIST